MKRLKNYSEFYKIFESEVSKSEDQREKNQKETQEVQEIPEDFKDFEEMMKQKPPQSEDEKGEINEAAGGLFGIVISGVLSAGKLIELIGKFFRRVVNWGKSLGIISGEKWESTKLEEWGKWYTEFLMKWVFKPIAKALLNSAQPFIQMCEIMSKSVSGDKSGKLTNYATEDFIVDFAHGIFYVTLTAVLATSIGPCAGYVASAMLGHIKLLGLLKTLLSGIKIWEVKHYLLAHLLKSKNSKFEEYDIKDIAHGLTDCHEEVGLSASLYYNFKKFNTTKVYNCLIGHLEHGH